MNGQSPVREELTKVASLVITARKLVAGGRLVDLSAIEERVRFVCRTIEDMDQDKSRELLDDMTALMVKLDRLGTDLEDQLGQVNACLGTGRE